MKIITKEISFCDQQTENVVDNENKSFILNKIKNYSIDLDYKSAIILNQKLLKNITYHQHLLTIKSSGTNYFLFLTNINDINYCFYIDRKIKQGYNFPRIISVKYRFDDVIYNDTLLDGEIIRNNNNEWHFLISDILIYKGETQNCNIISRYNLIHSILEKNYISDNNLEICPLIIKKIFLYNEWDDLINNFITKLDYNVRGLYFNTLNTKCTNYLYLFPRNHKFIEKKTSIKSIPLLLEKTNSSDIYNLYCTKENNLYNIGLAHIPSIISSKKIRKILLDKDSCKMLCVYSNKFKKWEPTELTELDIINYNDI